MFHQSVRAVDRRVMDNENEARPLLRSFERDTWGRRMRRRCWRIPTEVTITGAILGLFIVVVTLLVVFQNLETSDTNELQLAKPRTVLALAASPMKFNKKAEDQSWQKKKGSGKDKAKHSKWNKWGREVSDLPDDPDSGIPDEYLRTNAPGVNDEYGKEVDDDFQLLISQSWTNEGSDDDVTSHDETENLLQNSEAKWKKIDEGWKKLKDLGWKDKDIKAGLMQAILEERKSKLNQSESFLSPINPSLNAWKKGMDKSEKEQEKHKKINDEFKKKYENSNTSPSAFKWKNVDAGWKKLSKQGWTNRYISKAISDAIQDRKSALDQQMQILQSPTRLDEMWDKIDRKWKNKLYKGGDDEDSDDEMSENNLGLQQSAKAIENKWKKSDEGWKRLIEQGWKNNDIKEALIKAILEERASLDQKQELLQSPINIEDILTKLDDMLEKHMKIGLKEKEKQGKINDEWKNKMQVMKSSNPKADKWKQINEHWRKTAMEKNREHKEQEIQKAINDEWKNRMQLLQSPNPKADKWKQINKHWREISMDKNRDYKDQESKLNDDWKNRFQLFQSPSEKAYKWKKVNDGWKKVSEDWVNKDFKDAFSKAWKNRQSAAQAPVHFPNVWEQLGKLIETIKNMIPKGSKTPNYDESSGEAMDYLESPQKQDNIDEPIADDMWKVFLKQGWENNGIREALMNALKDTESSLGSKEDFKKFLEDVIETIKDLQKNKENSEESMENISDFGSIESLESYEDRDWNDNSMLRRNSTHRNWKDTESRKAMLKERKEGDKLSANSMKWKKVKKGWKNFSKKS